MSKGLTRSQAFTLAELLIALAILGVIATFTIPKLLQQQGDEKLKAIGKEAAGMISGAYDAYKLQNTPTASTHPGHLTPYMNYVKYYSSSLQVDAEQGNGTPYDCGGWGACIQLHNGAVMVLWQDSFGGTSSSNAIAFGLDPDGKVTDGTANGPGHSVWFILYYNGRLATWETMNTPTQTSSADYAGPCDLAATSSGCDPPWFNWD